MTSQPHLNFDFHSGLISLIPGPNCRHTRDRMASSASSLSSIASDDISDHDHDNTKQFLSPSQAGHHGHGHGHGHGASASHAIPPSKRRRTGVRSWDGNSTPISTTGLPEDAPPSPSASISSDTSGEISNSPATLALLGGTQEDDYSGQGNDQVTVCRWDGCDAGDLAHMDALVHHIHQDHIGSRQKKYSCEWADCNRKGQTHASGYALRAHMRSHTREKPFYCSLPGMFPPPASWVKLNLTKKKKKKKRMRSQLHPLRRPDETHANRSRNRSKT